MQSKHSMLCVVETNQITHLIKGIETVTFQRKSLKSNIYGLYTDTYLGVANNLIPYLARITAEICFSTVCVLSTEKVNL